MKLSFESDTIGVGGGGGHAPTETFNIRILKLARNEFHALKFPDFSNLWQIPWPFRRIPWLSEVYFKFSEFSKSVDTLWL